ncbi:MAG: hypothetical protein ABF976_13535 [Acetobacter syzygii]|uniref:hypothetical protein n=1 Tax=Acetobacter syzygii TaxID=146476 RepID=UPI0039ED9326
MSDVTAIPAKTVQCGKFSPALFADLVLVADTETDSAVDPAVIVDRIRQEALRVSGSSFECYSMKFSRAIDRKAAQLSGKDGAALMKFAQETGAYVSQQEENDLQSGCCEHGIDWGFCPAGCDEPDDEEHFEPDADIDDLHRLIMSEI